LGFYQPALCRLSPFFKARKIELRRFKNMALSKITFQASQASSPVTRYIQSDITLGQYLDDVEGVTSLSNVTVLVNGEDGDLNQELESGDEVTLATKKTASGQAAA
jgi:hypothetical protein